MLRQTPIKTSSNHYLEVPNVTPTSLLGYLKGLGLMAIADCEGYWQDNRFYLGIKSLKEVTEKFINNYEPKPIANPWNKASGFSAKKPLIEALLETSAPRYQRTKIVYQKIKETLATLDYRELKLNPSSETFSQKAKPIFFPLLATHIDDEAFTDWLSAVGIITRKNNEVRIALSDLLGTGGNVSSIDLAVTYLSCCEMLWNIEEGNPTSNCQILVEAAIEGISHPKSLMKKGILCHLSPISDYYGELNTKTGDFDYPPNGKSTQLSNPVEYILAIEGLLQFSGTVKALKESDGEAPETTVGLYPLLLEVNAGSADTSDRTNQSKHECWLPLWPEPMNLSQYRQGVLSHLQYRLSNQVRDTLDLLSLLSSASEYLEFNRYSRFGFWPRKGQGSFAIHIGIATPGKTDIGSELRKWRYGIHRALNPKDDRSQLSNATYELLISLEQRLVALQRGQGSLVELLILLGKVERHLSNLNSKYLLPVPRLTERWVQEVYEEMPTAEVRLAVSLASTGLRFYISRARYSKKSEKYVWIGRVGQIVPTQSLQTLALSLLTKWSLDLKHHPSQSNQVWSDRSDINQLIQGTINESFIVDLACGLSLCQIPHKIWKTESNNPLFLPLAYKCAATLQWSRDLVLNIQSINALVQRSTVPLLRQMRSQGFDLILPPVLSNGRRVAIALAFPTQPFFQSKE